MPMSNNSSRPVASTTPYHSYEKNGASVISQHTRRKDTIAVIVLGDIGHSPRMNYHALSLANEGYQVNLLGYEGSMPHSSIIENENITVTYMTSTPFWIQSLSHVFRLFGKMLWQGVILFCTLLFNVKPSAILVQNPPSVPTLPVCWFYCLVRNCKFLIDWHNYGHSILSLSMGKSHIVVKIYKWIEMTFGSFADGGLCVTKAMQEDLKNSWGVQNIIVHYDRPSSMFHPISDKEKHETYLKMGKNYSCFSSSFPDKSVLTECFAEGRVSFYEDRPALVVSSTSWTEDEDFSIFLFALEDYERVRTQFPDHYPQLIVAVTGKGPLKEHYTKKINGRKWQHVVVITPWLTPEEYPKLLASADLGISLHYSSSGLDLPMKVVDMFGCGLPVMAIGYPALAELVQHNKNGLIFSTKEELANLIQDWFRGFPQETAIKETYYDFYKNIAEFRKVSWQDSWNANVLPLIESLTSNKDN